MLVSQNRFIAPQRQAFGSRMPGGVQTPATPAEEVAAEIPTKLPRGQKIKTGLSYLGKKAGAGLDTVKKNILNPIGKGAAGTGKFLSKNWSKILLVSVALGEVSFISKCTCDTVRGNNADKTISKKVSIADYDKIQKNAKLALTYHGNTLYSQTGDMYKIAVRDSLEGSRVKPNTKYRIDSLLRLDSTKTALEAQARDIQHKADSLLELAKHAR